MKNNNYAADPMLRSYGVTIQSQFTKIDGRILVAPKLKAGGNDELFTRNCRWNFNNKIVGEITAPGGALEQVTFKLRDYLYQDFYPKDISPSPRIANSFAGSALGHEAGSNNKINLSRETGSANQLQNVQIVAPPAQATKDLSGSTKEVVKQIENERGQSSYFILLVSSMHKLF